MISLLFIITLNSASAQEMVTLEKGEKAPFSGTLLSTEAAAEIVTQLENAKEQCQIEINKQVSHCEVACDADLDTLTAEIVRTQEQCSVEKASLEGQIDLLENDVKRLSHPSRATMFSVGVGTGIAFTLVTAFAIGSIVN